MDNKTQEEHLTEFMAEMDARSQLRTARNDGLEEGRNEGEAIGLEKGRLEGRTEGEAIGLEKGEAIGLEKGRKEGLEEGRLEAKLETAKNLKSMNLSIESIAAATGLTEDQVRKL